MFNSVCFRTLTFENPSSITNYEKLGGYSSWKRILRDKISPDKIIEEVKKSGLRGRGGAGFPTGLKWSFMLNTSYENQRYVVCNSDEGEPGTCKDREILDKNPHQIIEGMAIASYAIGATIAYNYIRGEFFEPIKRFEKALREAKDLGLLGKNIRGSNINLEIFSTVGAGAYICGEETALLNSLEGKKGLPRFKPPFPANKGLYGCPTNINNTETYASIPLIFEKGSSWFKAIGTQKSAGTKIFCVSGHVNNPGTFELPLGTPFEKLVNLAGGVSGNRKIKAVIPGGGSSKVLTEKELTNLTMDYESLENIGSMIGSGGVIIIAEGTCMVKVLSILSKFYHEESCGQCTPCREGTGWISRILSRILDGKGSKEDIYNLDRVAHNIEGNTICGLGDAASWPVQSYIKKFKHEFLSIVKNK